MKKIGIINQDDIQTVGHILFNNLRLSLINYFKDFEFIDVTSPDQLDGLDYLFITDEHYSPHVDVWKNDIFIKTVNDLNLKVLVLNFEKIYNSQFHWNIDHQNKLETIKNLTQIFSDVEDRKAKNGILMKQCLSKDQKLIVDNVKKEEKIAFIGQAEGGQYHRRQALLTQIINKQTNIPFEIVSTNRKFTYQEFIQTMSKYKYIFNPLGCGDFINLRFYEALELGCIPIQQFTNEMLPHYATELEYCIPFIHLDDINLNKKFKKMDYYMEDFFEEINLANLL